MRTNWCWLAVFAFITVYDVLAIDRHGGATIRELGSTQVIETERSILDTLTAPRAPTTAPLLKKDAQNATVSVKTVSAPAVAAQPIRVVAREKQEVEAAVAPAAAVQPAQPIAPKSQPAPTAALKSETESKARLRSEPPAPKVDPAAAALRGENDKMKAELRMLKSQIERLERDLQTSRSQLATAELEVNRLSAVSDAKTRSSLSRFGLNPPSDANHRSGTVDRPQAAPPTQREGRAAIVPDVTLPSAGGSMPVATVSAEKADLRLGPGQNHSPLMSVSRGSRLLVEARQGEWYRVFAPSGERAWVHSSLVIFGGDAPAQSETSRVKGFNSDLETEAFRKFNRGNGQ